MNQKYIDYVFYKQLGEKLQTKRTEKGLSLRELSNITGLSRTILDYYELGIVKIKKDNLEIICNALGVNPMVNVEVKIGLED